MQKVLAKIRFLGYTSGMSATFPSFRAACVFFHDSLPHISYDTICEFVREKIAICEIIISGK